MAGQQPQHMMYNPQLGPNPHQSPYGAGQQPGMGANAAMGMMQNNGMAHMPGGGMLHKDNALLCLPLYSNRTSVVDLWLLLLVLLPKARHCPALCALCSRKAPQALQRTWHSGCPSAIQTEYSMSSSLPSHRSSAIALSWQTNNADMFFISSACISDALFELSLRG
jgi:hypothetical protein